MEFFDDAIASHIEWKERLRSHIDTNDTKIDLDTIGDFHRCELGAWIDGPGKEYNFLPSYQPLKDAHSHFHRCAEQIADAIKSGRFEQAEAMLAADGEYAIASTQTILAIGQLRADIEDLV